MHVYIIIFCCQILYAQYFDTTIDLERLIKLYIININYNNIKLNIIYIF